MFGDKIVLTARIASTKRRRLSLVARARGVSIGQGFGSSDDPTVHDGRLSIAGSSFAAAWPLPAANWKRLGKPTSNKGYKFTRGETITKVLIKRDRLVKIVGRGSGLPWDLASFPGTTNVTLTIGQHRYCWQFGGTATFKAGRQFKAVDAVAPVRCDAAPGSAD